MISEAVQDYVRTCDKKECRGVVDCSDWLRIKNHREVEVGRDLWRLSGPDLVVSRCLLDIFKDGTYPK